MPTKKAKKPQPSRAAVASVASIPANSSGLRADVHAFKRELIINAAIEVFYRDGYQSATVDDVAATMSVTKAVVYYYFKSKEALLQALIERCSVLTSAAIERGIAEGNTPERKLALAIFHFASMILGNQKLIALYFREERYYPAGLRERVTATEGAVTSKLSEVIDSGIRRRVFRSCDSQLLALNITGMVSMAFYWTAEHGRLPLIDLCRLFAKDALHLAGYHGDLAVETWLPSQVP